jgi:hypothetical protein
MFRPRRALVAGQKSLAPQYARELTDCRAEAESVLAGPAGGELPPTSSPPPAEARAGLLS